MSKDEKEKAVIKMLKEDILDKHNYINECAIKFKNSKRSIYNHWFSRSKYAALPKSKIDEIYSFTIEYIKKTKKSGLKLVVM